MPAYQGWEPLGNTLMSHGPSGDRTLVTFLDYIGLGLILVAIEEPGRRIFEGHHLSFYGWVAAGLTLLMGAFVLYVAKRIKDMPPTTENRLLQSLARLLP
jgi:hypothetical protein